MDQSADRPGLIVKDLTKTYPGVHFKTIFRDLSFDLARDRRLAVLGRNGQGKSTLIKLLLAEERPSKGKVFFESLDVHNLSTSEIPYVRRKIGTVFQDYKLLPLKTAYENIAFAMEVAGKSDEEIHEDVPQSLELVGLTDKADHFPSQLSGGEKQRVAIARALINRPDVILADEPAANLDPINTWEIIKLLQKINSLGTTVVLSTHDKEIINNLDKRVIVLDKGIIMSDKENGKYLL